VDNLDQFTEAFGSFKVAKVWTDVTNASDETNETNDKNETTQKEEVSDSFWKELLEGRYQEYFSQKSENLGRGQRKRKTVNYLYR
jgi:hypothetical protein